MIEPNEKTEIISLSWCGSAATVSCLFLSSAAVWGGVCSALISRTVPLQKRRLEKGLSREALTELRGVPTPTIAKFEQKHTISLSSYVALAKCIRAREWEHKTLLHLPVILRRTPNKWTRCSGVWCSNVLTDNKDDHAQNFSFICREGIWSLAPAYDLTLCSNGYNGEHVTSANNNGRATVEDMITVGESIRISREKGMNMIHSIAKGCSDTLSKDYHSII